MAKAKKGSNRGSKQESGVCRDCSEKDCGFHCYCCGEKNHSCDVSRECHNLNFKMVGIVGAYYGNGTFKIIEHNIRRADVYAVALANRRIPFFCGHLLSRHFEEKAIAPERFYKAQDMHILVSTCSALLVMPGWKKSSGTKAEIAVFQKLGRPIFYPKSLDDDVFSEIADWYFSYENDNEKSQ